MSTITWIMSKRGHHVLVYIDDFIRCEGNYLNGRKAFDALLDICAELGIALAPNKYLPPVIDVVWLGLYLDSSQLPSLTMSSLSATSGCPAPMMTRRTLQRLLARLAQVASCVPPARKFMGRLLASTEG